MVLAIAARLASLERWRAAAFLIGGVIFVADAVLLAVHIVAGTEPPLALGQAFVGAGWTAAFIGLLGFYPRLVDRNRWLIRAGAAASVIGLITMVAMAVTSLGYFTNTLSGELSAVVMLFLPGVFVGIVLGFVPFGVVSLRTDIYSRSIGVLFLILPMTFLFNVGTGIAGFDSLPKILGVVSVLALTMLAVGYLLRNGGVLAHYEEAASDPTA